MSPIKPTPLCPVRNVECDVLVSSEIRYRRLFETAQDGILLLNGETAQIEDVNPYMMVMLGYSHADFLGKKLWEIGAFSDIASSQANFDEILSKGYVRYEDLPLITAKGERIEVEFVSNSYDCDGIKVIQCNIRDISARKQAEMAVLVRNRELMESNVELERFAYVASHDLQTPLRNIVHFAQLLERRYKDKLDAAADEFIGFIVDGAKQMGTLITDILEYSRIRGHSIPMQPVRAADALAQAVGVLGPEIEATGATITVGDLPKVMAEPTHLASLFQNLLGNSLKYLSPDRPLTISVSAERAGANLWRFAVTDNGIGIEAAYHNKVFEIFQRLNPAAEAEGTGIGLTMCRHIIHRFGGTIWVESKPGTLGATFFFTLLDASPAV
ncbi:sensor histidine kinase [Paramagnetospirillum marisnigri]|uniref:sensor histidine kinase n=1 Tax=Paramagnetospirillum marisnigri TaxID=1285242 RepID=UPI0009ECD7B7|nr:ATP-binding protein [Paramagnetospirillum marisnigri]